MTAFRVFAVWGKLQVPRHTKHAGIFYKVHGLVSLVYFMLLEDGHHLPDRAFATVFTKLGGRFLTLLHQLWFLQVRRAFSRALRMASNTMRIALACLQHFSKAKPCPVWQR